MVGMTWMWTLKNAKLFYCKSYQVLSPELVKREKMPIFGLFFTFAIHNRGHLGQDKNYYKKILYFRFSLQKNFGKRLKQAACILLGV